MNICAIVLDYRNAKRTEACLRSLLGQGLYRVLVVDNSANQQASEKLKAVIQRLKGNASDYALDLLQPNANLGFARGVNYALQQKLAADCDILLLMNNDALAAPDMVPLLAAAIINKSADLVTPTVLNNADIPQPAFWYQRFFGLLTIHRLPFSFTYPSGCCFLFHRSLIESGKLFDEDFFMYGEDTLLGWQMTRKRKKMACVEKAIVYHTGQASSHKCTLFYEYHMTRAHILLAIKTWNNPLEIPFLVTTKAIGLAIRAVLRCLRYRRMTPLIASLLAWIPLDIRVS